MRLNSPQFRRVKSRLILCSVDKWLTKSYIKKIKSLKISDLIKNRVPRTATRILLEFTRKVSWRHYAKCNVIYLYISVLCGCNSNV